MKLFGGVVRAHRVLAGFPRATTTRLIAVSVAANSMLIAQVKALVQAAVEFPEREGWRDLDVLLVEASPDAVRRAARTLTRARGDG